MKPPVIAYIKHDCSSLALLEKPQSFRYSHHMHWLQSIHILPVFHFGPCAIWDQNGQHFKKRDWFARQCWYFSGLGTEERWLTKLFQCACHQLLYHNWLYIFSPFFYPMWVQPWVKHIKNLIWYISTFFEMDTFRKHLHVAVLKSVHPIKHTSRGGPRDVVKMDGRVFKCSA